MQLLSAILAIALRLWARQLKQTQPAFNDFVIAAALVACIEPSLQDCSLRDQQCSQMRQAITPTISRYEGAVQSLSLAG